MEIDSNIRDYDFIFVESKKETGTGKKESKKKECKQEIKGNGGDLLPQKRDAAPEMETGVNGAGNENLIKHV